MLFIFNMKSQHGIVVSINAIEKYLDARIIHASVFFNQHMMYESIGKCLIQCSIVIGRCFDPGLLVTIEIILNPSIEFVNMVAKMIKFHQFCVTL